MWKDCETELDFLDFDYLIHILKDTVNNEELLPSSIGVYGDWGSGKSSLIKMSIKLLEQEKDTVCLVFNGWLFEGYDDAKTAVMGSILDTIQEKRKLGKKAKACISGLYKSVDKLKLLKNGIKYGADFILTGGIGTIADITINSLASKVSENVTGIDFEAAKKSIQDELSNKTIREDIKKFQKNFELLLKETKIKRLVVFIDELDRCSPDTILDTLEAIRLFLFTGNIAFIIGADERHISYAVKKKFREIEGIQIDIGKEYLEKMIQYPIRIPRLNVKKVEFYITCLLFQKDLDKQQFNKMIDFLNSEKRKDFLKFDINYKMIENGLPDICEKVKDSIVIAKQLSAVLANGLNGNPRHCKRFLNSLNMRMNMAKYKNINLDRKILAKIMMLEYFKLPLFKKLAQMSARGDSRGELKLFEDGKINELNELKLWKDDYWVQEWIKIKPSISDIELAPYFYFTRTSLDEKFSSLKTKLSLIGEEINEKLLSKSDVALKQALMHMDDINEYEASEILDNLYNNMISESTIDNNLFEAFLEWGASKTNLISNTISYLKSIPGSRISISFYPFINSFVEKTNKSNEVKEISDKWVQENIKLKSVAEISLK